MFLRRAAIEVSDVMVKDQGTWSWKKIVEKATLERRSDFLPQEAFEYAPEDFLYFRARSITADIANGNGDFFPLRELEASYKTFVGKGFYLEHDSDSIEKAKGIILDAVWYPEQKYVECLVAVDRKTFPEIARQIETGILGSVSMGCVVEEAECSVCHNVAHTQKELCAHMNPMQPTYTKGKIMSNGERAYEINRKVTFSELSGVAQPADFEAHVFEVFASVQKQLMQHYADYKNKKAIKEGCPDGKCTIDLAISRLSVDERQFLKASLDKAAAVEDWFCDDCQQDIHDNQRARAHKEKGHKVREVKSSLSKEALNSQSPSTFQGNPAVDSGSANPKKVTDFPSIDMVPGNAGFIEKRKTERRKPLGEPVVSIDTKSSVVSKHTRKADCECGGSCGGDSPVVVADPATVQIEKQIEQAIKDQIDMAIQAEVQGQVNLLMSDLMNNVQQAVKEEVMRQVMEKREDVAGDVAQVVKEIAVPPQVSAPGDAVESYGPFAMASMALDSAIHNAALESGVRDILLEALPEVVAKNMKPAQIEIGYGLYLRRAGKDNFYQLHRNQEATSVWVEDRNPEEAEAKKIARFREDLGIDLKTDGIGNAENQKLKEAH